MKGLSAKRSKLRIIFDILIVAKEGAPKTRIQYKASLSYQQCRKYLEVLMDENLLRKESNCYFTTADGASLIEICKICFSLYNLL